MADEEKTVDGISDILSRSDQRLAEARAANDAARYNNTAPAPTPPAQPSPFPQPPVMATTPPQAPVQAPFPQPQYPAAIPQPQQPIFPTLVVLEALHQRFEANRHIPGMYPDDLRDATIGEIEKLRMYQKRMNAIPDQTRIMVDTLLSQVISPFYQPK